MSKLLQPGTILHNRYEVVRLTGQGGMGAVYEAIDQTFGSSVALKQQITSNIPSAEQSATLQEAFKREASILHLLHHPALPRVTDYFSDASGQFLVMDFIHGNDLSGLLEQRLRQHGAPFSPDEVLNWADQVLSVLHYLHTRPTPVIHRDVKPHNLKLTPQGEIILLDLGLAKLSPAQQNRTTGGASIRAYSLPYASLEQIQGTGTSARSDLYSLAATMYHLLTGKSPADAQPPVDAMSRATAVLFNQSDPLQPLPGVPPLVNDLLMRALALKPDDRIESAAAMRNALVAARQTQAPPYTEQTIIAPPTPAPPSVSPAPPVYQSLPCSAGSLVAGVACSPDGQTFAAACGDGSVRVWQVRNGGLLRTLKGHTGSVRSVAFSPHNQILASGSDDTTVRLWRVRDGALLHTLYGHGDKVRSVAFSPDGTTLASGGWDRTVRLWRVSDGILLHTFQEAQGDVWSVAFSPDGYTLAAGSSDTTVRLWRVSPGQSPGQRHALLHTFRGHANWVWSVAFSPDGHTLATGAVDRSVRLWRLDGESTYALVRELEAPGHVAALAFSSDGHTLAAATSEHTIQLWRMHDGAPLRILKGHTDAVTGLAFGASSQFLLSSSIDATIRLWGLTMPAADWQRMEQAWKQQPSPAAVPPPASSRKQDDQKEKSAPVLDIAFAPDGRTLAVATADYTVHLFDLASGSLARVLRGAGGRVRSVAFSPDGQTLATGAEDREVRLWRAHDGTLLRTLKGHTADVRSVAFSPDGKTLASGGWDGTARLWRAHDGTLLHTLHPAGGGDVWSVAFSPDGKLIAVAVGSKAVQVWRTRGGTLLRTLKGHKNWVFRVAFSPDGRTIASGALDRTARLWRVRDGTLLHTLRVAGAVLGLAFSPDGGVLALALDDRTAQLWRVRDGTLLHTLRGHSGSVTSVAFAPDGKTLASASLDQEVKLWDVE